MVDRVVPPSPAIPLTDSSGMMDQEFRAFTQKIALRALIIGSGAPNGVVEAGQGALYMDESAATGDIQYIKRLADVGGDKTQGWRAV